jgi:2-keto-4-pentenoate hydratase
MQRPGDAPQVDERLRSATAALLERRRERCAAGAAHVGWKLAFGIDAIEEVLGDEPGIGYLTSATQFVDGEPFSAEGTRNLCAETEIAVVVGPGSSIAGLTVALELVDVGRTQDDLREVVEENVLHCAFALGPAVAIDDASELVASLTIDGRFRDEVTVRRDFEEHLRQATRVLEAVGERLAPGDRLLTGSLIAVPVAPGERVTAAVTGLGSVHAAVTP